MAWAISAPALPPGDPPRPAREQPHDRRHDTEGQVMWSPPAEAGGARIRSRGFRFSSSISASISKVFILPLIYQAR